MIRKKIDFCSKVSLTGPEKAVWRKSTDRNLVIRYLYLQLRKNPRGEKAVWVLLLSSPYCCCCMGNSNQLRGGRELSLSLPLSGSLSLSLFYFLLQEATTAISLPPPPHPTHRKTLIQAWPVIMQLALSLEFPWRGSLYFLWGELAKIELNIKGTEVRDFMSHFWGNWLRLRLRRELCS